MEVKRLFIATFVEQRIFGRHFDNIKSLFGDSCSGKWTELNNLHFTYKFLGNVEIGKLDEVKDALKGITGNYDSVLKFNGLGCLLRKNEPDILYARIYSPDKSTNKHFFDIEKRMIDLGFAKERKKFLPHVSLLRIKIHNENFREIFETNKNLYIGKQVKYSINLVASTLTHDGPIYDIIE
ncbi:RNA 2',3'-cyclic phosphodiesterase [Candidatus Kapaibacterium sp.]